MTSHKCRGDLRRGVRVLHLERLRRRSLDGLRAERAQLRHLATVERLHRKQVNPPIPPPPHLLWQERGGYEWAREAYRSVLREAEWTGVTVFVGGAWVQLHHVGSLKMASWVVRVICSAVGEVCFAGLWG